MFDYFNDERMIFKKYQEYKIDFFIINFNKKIVRNK